MSDYYEILGVSRDASTEEIKRAYRKLARQHHPDVAGVASEEKFKNITAAHDTLSNPEKRRAYDMGGGMPGMGGAGAAGFGGFSDIFETFFQAAAGGTGQRGPAPRSRRGQDALLRVSIDLSEAAFGVARDLEVETAVVCTTCQGTCCQPGTHPKTCDTCQGRGSVQRVARSFLGQVMTTAACAVCGGYGTIITDPCTECSGEGRVRTRRTVRVNIPAGVDEGTRIKLSGQSEVGPAGGPPGDLYVEIREKPHPVFTRRGDDIHCSTALPMTAAALGTMLNLDTLDGPQEVDIRPGTQPEEVVTLRGLGVGHLNGTGRGDLHVHVDVEVPTKLDEAQEELLRQLATARGEERPEARLSAANPGMLHRLREKFGGR
ncbi:molecular chaperone DnaJ [Occultella gossypii]|uniref:Chaperone protein DnaJ n=1 Tax=Occultella gossypii TaxID=2800820 RepID=A0ABS7S7P9_9MICO|nr:molecular chaperone DnaJ [Occultella gossypii]MBZ2195218.1 molecular chaperone DnaJ [Occultella gossypii]